MALFSFANKKNFLNTLLLTIMSSFLMLSNASAQTQQTWEHQNFNVRGTWAIEKKSDGHYITLSDEFKTKKAPDLKIFLSKNSADNITGKTATKNAALVAKLSSHKGGQSYKIPAHINMNDYQSMIIHCEKYSKLWASTPLR